MSQLLSPHIYWLLVTVLSTFSLVIYIFQSKQTGYFFLGLSLGVTITLLGLTPIVLIPLAALMLSALYDLILWFISRG
jgi:hypothetical protein